MVRDPELFDQQDLLVHTAALTICGVLSALPSLVGIRSLPLTQQVSHFTSHFAETTEHGSERTEFGLRAAGVRCDHQHVFSALLLVHLLFLPFVLPRSVHPRVARFLSNSDLPPQEVFRQKVSII